MTKRLFCPLALAAMVVAAPKVATAATLTFDYNVQFSNGTLPGGPGPWLRATFDDTTAGVGYDVRLTLEVLSLTATEFTSDWWFNLNPAINPANISFNTVDASDATLDDIDWGTDCCNADGGGRYDIKFEFQNSNGAGRFTNGETFVIDINWSLGALLASDFNFIATPQGGNGPFLAATHIQGIVEGDGSTFVAPVAAPEPGSLLLLGAGLSFAARRLRRTK